MNSPDYRDWFLRKIEAGSQMRFELERDGVRSVASMQKHRGVYKACIFRHPLDYGHLDEGEMFGCSFATLNDAESWLSSHLETDQIGMTVCKGLRSFEPENIPEDGTLVEM